MRAFGGLQLLQTASRVAEVMRRATLIDADGGAIGDDPVAPDFLPAA